MIGPKPPTPSDLLGKNPSVAGTSSTASNTGSGSDGESDQVSNYPTNTFKGD